MKKKLLIYFCALFAGVMLYSCGNNDQKIRESVQTSVTATAPGINVAVKDGVVTLSGTVNSEAEKSAAEAAAKNVNNVKTVHNNIMVNAPAMPTTTPNTTMQGDTLARHINNSLTSAGFTGITVTTQNGEVTLTGDVKRSDLQRIMQIANESNPTRVNNQLTVK